MSNAARPWPPAWRWRANGATVQANHATPSHLGSEAKPRLWASKLRHRSAKCFDRKEIEKLGMGSFLAVAQGSDEPPRFIVARVRPARQVSEAPTCAGWQGHHVRHGRHLAQARRRDGRDEVRHVRRRQRARHLARAIGEWVKPKVNLVGLIAACENMPSGRAVKPGDVVTSLSGQTIEILNTDAEGRLILCDALTYAERFKPACGGRHCHPDRRLRHRPGRTTTQRPVFANDDALAARTARRQPGGHR